MGHHGLPRRNPQAADHRDRASPPAPGVGRGSGAEIGLAGYAEGSGLCVPSAGDLFAAGMQARVGGAPAPAP